MGMAVQAQRKRNHVNTDMHRIISKILPLMAVMLFALPPYTFAHPTETDTIISLITCAPGGEVYELEGHTALRIQDKQNDVIVNWGLFDFNAPFFVYRFVKGQTDYMCGEMPTGAFLSHYIQSGRQVTEQVLNLTPEETRKIIAAINENLKPENRIYRYNYVKDNCATRPLDIISAALGDTIRLAVPPETLTGETPTYRSIMQANHRNYPWYQFGIDLLLGNGIDYPITRKEAAFAPEVLMHMMKLSAVGDRPLVSDTNILYKSSDATEGPTPWFLTPLACFSLLLVLTIFVTLVDVRSKEISRWFDTQLFIVFGLVGCLITFLVFFSAHEATTPNLLILWLNPFCLLVPALIRVKKCAIFLVIYQIINIIAICVMIILMVRMNQNINPAFIPLWACDIIRAWSYIHITLCVRKRKNLYRIRYSGYSSYR